MNDLRQATEATPPPEGERREKHRSSGAFRPRQEGRTRGGYEAVRRALDIGIALAAMPVVGIAAAALALANPIWNPGPVFFRQRRMGRDCQPFEVLKFRTMRPAETIARGPDDPVEQDRITPLGRLLRQTRIDELPQFINVLRGEMSLIGPRPDCWDHAVHYLDAIPGYRERHAIRPGITGLAQVDGGYAEGIAATVEKTRLDLDYIRRRSPRLDAYILRRTVRVVLFRDGAR